MSGGVAEGYIEEHFFAVDTEVRAYPKPPRAQKNTLQVRRFFVFVFSLFQGDS